MGNERALLAKRVRADGAHVRSLPGVDPHMSLEVVPLGETFVAGVTHERPVT